VVKVDLALGYYSKAETSCPPGDLHMRCYQITAYGVSSVLQPRLWKLVFDERVEVHPIPANYYGTWTLTALDGSSDSLSGITHNLWYYSPELWKVTGGTGAYAGAVDATPDGTAQDFSVREFWVPTQGTYAPIPLAIGSLAFTIQ